ncbi:MAG TPA: MoaD/ThiS family protein [Spirochaetota bacterium]|nr:MoaD/ThiS family protein [Spirochaetota bacterium]
MAKVTIPVQYRKLANNEAYFYSKRERVIDIVAELTEVYPRLKPLLLDETGSFRSSVLFFIDKKDIRTLNGADTVVSEKSDLRIVPAIAGG